MLNVFISLVILAGIGLAVLYNTRYRNHPWDKYYPRLAWMRGCMYFSACYTVAYFTGALELLLTTPVATAEQLANPNWRWFTAAVLGFVLLAYGGLWSYFTPVFERRKNTLISALFGFLWGSSSGLLFLSVWLLANLLPVPVWAASVLTFVLLGAYQPNWHNIYWDHYIAPEHDTPLTQVIKASCCHIPNLAIALTYLTIYGNHHIFVLAQVVACTSAAIGMRFPAPWTAPSDLDYAHRTKARIPRCTGYIPDDPKTDAYTPFYPGWRGQKS